jgi:hypothetical protein
MAIDICREKEPELKLVGEEHWVSCHLVKGVAAPVKTAAVK